MTSRFIIPSLLAATILIAGVFAFMPVQDASTVHTTIGVPTLLTKSDTNFNQGEFITLTCTSATIIDWMFVDFSGAGYQNADVIDVIIDVDGGGAANPRTHIADLEGDPIDSSITLALGTLALGPNGTIQVIFTTENADATTEAIDIHYGFRSSGTCT